MSEASLIVAACAVRAGRRAPSEALAQDLDAMFSDALPAVTSVCRRFVRDPERARELAQETLLVAWRRLPEYRPPTPFRTWVYGIARHLCANAVRKRTETLVDDGVIDDVDPASAALGHLLRAEREELVRTVSLRVLDEQEQEAVYLRYVECLSQEAITGLLGLDGTGARALLQRCRRKLARELRAELALRGHGTSFVRGST